MSKPSISRNSATLRPMNTSRDLERRAIVEIQIRARRGTAPYGSGCKTGPSPRSRAPACTCSHPSPARRRNSRLGTGRRGRASEHNSEWWKARSSPTGEVALISSPLSSSMSRDRWGFIFCPLHDVVRMRAAASARGKAAPLWWGVLVVA